MRIVAFLLLDCAERPARRSRQSEIIESTRGDGHTNGIGLIRLLKVALKTGKECTGMYIP